MGMDYCANCGGDCMNYASTVDKAKEWGVSQRRVAVYCKEGRIKGRSF